MIQTLSEALAERGYDELTPVQQAVTEAGLEAADLLVSAQTGSGKTVAFGLAIAPTLLGDQDALGPAAAPLALVVAPTRELAFQVMRELGWLYAKAGARVVSCVGGMDMREERRALERGAHIVVGTPGRLRDHIQRGSLEMGHLRAVVLDEADEMLDLGFREDLEFMLGQAPQDRRTLMFSATVPPQIAKLATQYQRDAVRVSTQSGTRQHADIAYQALRVASFDAENAIINVLRFHDAQTAIVFANTRATVSRLGARFSNRGFPVVTLSGELSQKERTHALQAMRDGRARVCIATDVAARGIDLPNLELVIHAELPSNAEGLLHRSGRTGRAGRKGTSVLIVPPKAARRAEMLLRAGRIEAEWGTAPTADEILRRDEERLLADPVWSEDASEEDAAFIKKLLALHSPERIAAAYLRLYRSGQSAPEELAATDAPSEPKPRKAFGPSTWFALSVGRDSRAEARWLLPLLCRAGNLDKDAIGAIRVQQTESFVEIGKDRAAGFLAALGASSQLEEGITVRQIDGPPDLSPRAAAPASPRRHRAEELRAADPSPVDGSPRGAGDGPDEQQLRSETSRARALGEDAPSPSKPRTRSLKAADRTAQSRSDEFGDAVRPRAPAHRPVAPKGEGSAAARTKASTDKPGRKGAREKPAMAASSAGGPPKRPAPAGRSTPEAKGRKDRTGKPRPSHPGSAPPKGGKR